MGRTFLTIVVIALVLILTPIFTGYSYASNNKPVVAPATTALREDFDPVLFRELKSIDDLVRYINYNFKGDKSSPDFPSYIGKIIARRFYHAYSYYSQEDNWLAAFAGQYVWKDLSAIVLPDDIMKHPNAACSQQSIILIECAKRFHIPYRKVSFDHHFAVELRSGDKWIFIDTDQEVIPMKGSLEEIMKNDELYTLYKDKFTREEFNIMMNNPRYGETNESIALKAKLFHSTSNILSEYFFCFLFFLQALVYYAYVRKDRPYIEFSQNKFYLPFVS